MYDLFVYWDDEISRGYCTFVLWQFIMPGRPAHSVTPNKDGTITIEYHPMDAGVHELNLNYNDQQVEGNKHSIISQLYVKVQKKW